MAFETQSGQLALRLAAFFAAPGALIPADQHLDPALAAALPAQGLAGRARNRALASALGFQGASFASGFRDRLASSDRCQAAVALVLAPAEALRRTMTLLAAAIYQNRLRAAVLKADREAMTAALGEEAVQTGLRQAPIFASALAALARPDAAPGPELTTDAAGVAQALVGIEDPLLARILGLRLDARAPARALTEAQQTAAWRIVEGRR